MRRQELAYRFGVDLDPSLSRHFEIVDVSPKVVAVAAVVF